MTEFNSPLDYALVLEIHNLLMSILEGNIYQYIEKEIIIEDISQAAWENLSEPFLFR